MITVKHILKYIFRNEIPLKTLIKRGLIIGKNVKIMRDVIIDPGHCWLIEIGDNVTIAPRVIILAHDASTYNSLGYTKIGKVKIGDNVFIGAGAIILPSVRIGDNVIIGAGCLVSNDVPDNTVVSGNPMKIICSYEQFIEKHRTMMRNDNVFDEDYTMRGGITFIKKEEQRKILEKNKYGYVK